MSPPEPAGPGRSWTPLPRGRHRLPTEFVVSNQRERMLDSMAEMVSAKGYSRVTVTDVTKHAGVSRRTFYDQFSDKEDCFLATFAAVGDQLVHLAQLSAPQDGGPWTDGVRRALDALLDFLAAEPALARIVLVEVLAAGNAALEARDGLLDRFAGLLQPRGAAADIVAADRRIVRAVIGGVYETLYHSVLAGEVEHLPQLAPDLVYCVLVPFVGHAAALAERERSA
jgi:AcrR family transcriptional regulator